MTRFDEFGPNSGFAEELYHRYLDAPMSVDAEWRAYFVAREAPARAATEGSDTPEAAHNGLFAPPPRPAAQTRPRARDPQP